MKRKGFTLTELVVTLAVSGVLLAMVLTMVISIASFNRIREERTAVNEETLLTKTRFTDWFSGKDTSSNAAPKVSLDGEQLFFGDEIAQFHQTSKLLSLGENTYQTQYIAGIYFAIDGANGNLVKCTVVYTLDGATQSCVFMLLKRSANG